MKSRKKKSFNYSLVVIIIVVIYMFLGSQVKGITLFSKKAKATEEAEGKYTTASYGASMIGGSVFYQIKELLNAYIDEIRGNEYLILANKEVRLEESYEPDNLVLPKVAFTESSDMIVRVMEEKAAKALEELFEAAKADGINLLANSGYRSYSIQKSLYERNLRVNGRAHTEKYSAQPGASEHQTGLAMDIVAEDYQSLDEGFENTKAFKWLSENAYKYGFILRYLKDSEDITGYAYEPWHYRYVGQAYSEYITKNNLTLEEFLNKR